ncbi:MAG: hypothetical protein ACOYT7_00600 [Patescibacteria group bacterium]
MRILIVEDSTENLEAAKQAAVEFPEHEFSFTSSAKEAIVKMAEVDAVITDLFFPNEGHEDGGELDMLYALYRSKMVDNPAFDEVVRSYYKGDESRANEKLADALGLLEDGTIRNAVKRLICFFEGEGNKEWADMYRKKLKNLPRPQFPYGGAIVLKAKKIGKRICLVSDIHRHAESYKNAADAIDGMMLLLPLIGEGIISVEQATYDGRNSLTYLGSDEIAETDKGRGEKSDAAVWAEAIRRILAQ